MLTKLSSINYHDFDESQAAGFSLDSQTRQLSTPLHVAVQSAHLEVRPWRWLIHLGNMLIFHDFPRENADFPRKNCDFPKENGGFLRDNADFSEGKC